MHPVYKELKDAVREAAKNDTLANVARVQHACDNVAHYLQEIFKKKIKAIKDSCT